MSSPHGKDVGVLLSVFLLFFSILFIIIIIIYVSTSSVIGCSLSDIWKRAFRVLISLRVFDILLRCASTLLVAGILLALGAPLTCCIISCTQSQGDESKKPESGEGVIRIGKTCGDPKASSTYQVEEDKSRQPAKVHLNLWKSRNIYCLSNYPYLLSTNPGLRRNYWESYLT